MVDLVLGVGVSLVVTQDLLTLLSGQLPVIIFKFYLIQLTQKQATFLQMEVLLLVFPPILVQLQVLFFGIARGLISLAIHLALIALQMLFRLMLHS